MKMFLSGSCRPIGGESIFFPKGTKIHGSSDSVYARIDNERGLFVLNPDMLIAPTKIAEAIGCVRRGVISDRVKLFGGFQKAAVLGNLRHSFIEVCVSLMYSTDDEE